MTKTNLVLFIFIFIAYIGGYLTAYKKPVVHSSSIASANINTSTVTDIGYSSKKGKEDIDVVIDKQSLIVSVNGVEQTIVKSDTEDYVLEKNSLKLKQQSRSIVEIKTDVIDKTRRYNIGVGYGNHGLSTMLRVALPYVSFLDAFAYADSETVSCGISVSF